jgi:hypothetical protein
MKEEHRVYFTMRNIRRRSIWRAKNDHFREELSLGTLIRICKDTVNITSQGFSFFGKEMINAAQLEGVKTLR